MFLNNLERVYIIFYSVVVLKLIINNSTIAILSRYWVRYVNSGNRTRRDLQLHPVFVEFYVFYCLHLESARKVYYKQSLNRFEGIHSACF